MSDVENLEKFQENYLTHYTEPAVGLCARTAGDPHQSQGDKDPLEFRQTITFEPPQLKPFSNFLWDGITYKIPIEGVYSVSLSFLAKEPLPSSQNVVKAGIYLNDDEILWVKKGTLREDANHFRELGGSVKGIIRAVLGDSIRVYISSTEPTYVREVTEAFLSIHRVGG